MTHVADEPAADIIDLVFALGGGALPREHRFALAEALDAALPWLATLPMAGVHRLNIAAGGGRDALLSGRTRLTLRLPRDKAAAAEAALNGTTLAVAGGSLHVGAAQLRELLPHGTLYAHLVAAGQGDEMQFMQDVQQELAALGVAGRPICGRHQLAEGGALHGYGLMLDALTAAHSLRVQQAGLGLHRRLGCGVFVPHKSAAAVGTPL